jgi:hypothetical protein
MPQAKKLSPPFVELLSFLNSVKCKNRRLLFAEITTNDEKSAHEIAWFIFKVK